MRLAVQIGPLRFEVDLLDTATARALAVSTPVKAKLENDARRVVDPGTVCCWTQGSSPR